MDPRYAWIQPSIYVIACIAGSFLAVRISLARIDERVKALEAAHTQFVADSGRKHDTLFDLVKNESEARHRLELEVANGCVSKSEIVALQANLTHALCQLTRQLEKKGAVQ